MQQGVIGGKIGGQPTRVLLNLYNQEKSKMEVQEAEGSYSSKTKQNISRPELVCRSRTIWLTEKLGSQDEGPHNTMVSIY